LDIRLCTVEEFATEQPEGFDVVCSFHVLEHLPHLRSYVLGMLACLRSGGLLIVSVPNRLRTIDPEFPEPLDSPPHHVSRWHPRQLHALGELFNLDPIALEFDPPTLADCREHIRVAASQRLSRFTRGRLIKVNRFFSRALGRILFPSLVYRVLSNLSLISRLGIYRQSMLAVFRKRSDPRLRMELTERR
jgi:2-polyprenyl-3-methyl-5-hydroxy-6-metoxy-1,4-benzoquinol methylase